MTEYVFQSKINQKSFVDFLIRIKANRVTDINFRQRKSSAETTT